MLPVEYNILTHGRSAKSYFLCVVYQVLACCFVPFDVHIWNLYHNNDSPKVNL